MNLRDPVGLVDQVDKTKMKKTYGKKHILKYHLKGLVEFVDEVDGFHVLDRSPMVILMIIIQKDDDGMGL